MAEHNGLRLPCFRICTHQNQCADRPLKTQREHLLRWSVLCCNSIFLSFLGVYADSSNLYKTKSKRGVVLAGQNKKYRHVF